jgi:hypothetical protein
MTRETPSRGAAAGRLILGALVATFALGCNPDAAVEPPAAQAGTAPALLSANAAPLSNRFAYALADQPTSPSYAPSFSYNATGGGVRITRFGPGGGYAVTFGGLNRAPGETEVFIVTTFGTTNAHCVAGFSTVSGSSATVNVFCIDPIQGTGVDSRFSVLAVGSNSLPARSAFAYANNIFAPSYTPDPNFSYTSAGGAINIVHDTMPGNYRVNFGTGNPAGSAFLVNSRITPEQCHIGEWLPTTARVRCFDSGSGAPADVDYQVLQVGAGRPGRRIGYAFADRGSAASYTPTAAFSHNSSGGTIKITRSMPGRYAVVFNGLQRPAGHTDDVQVTPFGQVYANCAVAGVTSLASGLRAIVNCRDIAGNFHDSRFEILVIE